MKIKGMAILLSPGWFFFSMHGYECRGCFCNVIKLCTTSFRYPLSYFSGWHLPSIDHLNSLSTSMEYLQCESDVFSFLFFFPLFIFFCVIVIDQASMQI